MKKVPKMYKESQDGRKERVRNEGSAFRERVVEDKKKRASKNACRKGGKNYE